MHVNLKPLLSESYLDSFEGIDGMAGVERWISDGLGFNIPISESDSGRRWDVAVEMQALHGPLAASSTATTHLIRKLG